MLVDHTPCVFNQQAALGGQFYRLADPFKQWLADFIFEPLDLHAYGGLGSVDLPAGPGKAFGIRDGNERF
jgi:hypothetical protein